MSKHEKLLKRIAARPKDLTWSELVSLMSSLSFEMERSSGSGRKFINADTHATLFIHEPHPAKVLKSYQVRDAIHFLKEEGYLS
jgi:hypothetical protein